MIIFCFQSYYDEKYLNKTFKKSYFNMNDNEDEKQLAPFIERLSYLRSLVNSLVLQNLACGNIPKVKPGVNMNIEALTQLKEDIDFKISQTLKHELFLDLKERDSE
mgnify:CR=1 FL=1